MTDRRGQSYGTILGQYIAALYPDKIGRFVLDGVHDALAYREGGWESGLDDTDKIAAAFYEFCAQAGPEKCAVAEATTPETYLRVKAIWNTLIDDPIAVPFGSNGPTVLTADMLHRFMFRGCYQPVAFFPILAEKLAAVERRDVGALQNITSDFMAPAYECSCSVERPWNSRTEADLAVACTDMDVVSSSPDQFIPFFQKLSNTSFFAGPLWAEARVHCSEWKFRAKKRYTGPFEAKETSNPILLVSTTWDPVCPLSHAKIVNERFPGSRLLEQRSYGHCSTSSTSFCTARAIRAYFNNGTLPDEGTVCQVDELPLVGNVKEDLHLMSSDDVQLWGALKELTKIELRFGLVSF